MKNRPIASHLLVIIQLTGVVLSCYPVGLNNLGSIDWLALCAIGIALGITTLLFNKIGNFSIYPEPKPDAVLITNGPYRFVRHPMYTSLIIMMVGIAMYNGHEINIVGVILVMVSVFLKARVEEKLLLTHFPSYAEYQQHTQKFIPHIF